ncbi:MAG TPA: hypothetical protein VE031_02040 [Chthoniobacterales bacterium]|nr:hypothetical protein [Chthoniobacterales bacterium]
MNALTLSQVEDFNTIVSQRADEQSIAGRVEIEMIDSPFNSGERNRLLELQCFCGGLGSDETVAECSDQDSKKELESAIHAR